VNYTELEVVNSGFRELIEPPKTVPPSANRTARS